MPNTFLTTDGDLYASASGNAGNIGDADNPKSTISEMLAAASNGQKLVCGGGIYTEAGGINITSPNVRLAGDVQRIVTIDGQGNTNGVTMGIGGLNALENLYITGYTFPLVLGAQGLRSGQIMYSIFEGGTINNFGATANVANIEYSLLINLNINHLATSTVGVMFAECSLVNCTFNDMEAIQYDSIESTLFKDCVFNFAAPDNPGDPLDMASKFINCWFQDCTFTYDGETYSTLSGIVAEYGGFLNCQEGDPQLLGDLTRQETVIERTSPLFGSGVAGVNIGGVQIGLLQNVTTAEFGTSPDTNNNTQWNGNALEVTAGAVGNRVAQEQNIGFTTTPIVYSNGASNYQDNVPSDSNDLVNYNALTYSATWRKETELPQGPAIFRYNVPMTVDGSGFGNGDPNFVGPGTEIQAKYLQIDVTLRNNFTKQ